MGAASGASFANVDTSWAGRPIHPPSIEESVAKCISGEEFLSVARRNIVENVIISLEVSSAILTCQTSPAGSMIFMSLLQVPSEKLNSPP